MSVKSLVPGFIKKRIPLEKKFAMERMLEDLPRKYRFLANSPRRKEAFKEYQQCQTPDELMAFSQKWLDIGSVQKRGEILPVLEKIASEFPVRMCEIGTEHGGTNLLFSQSLPSLQVMIGVDLFIKNKAQLQLFHRPDQSVCLLNGSSYTPQMVKRVEDVLQGEKLDVLFIDGDHHYEGAKKDFLMYRHLVREDGFVLFHDIILDHHARFGKDTPGWSGGVPILWERLKKFYPNQEFVENHDQDGMGIGMLRFSSSVILPQKFIESIE